MIAYAESMAATRRRARLYHGNVPDREAQRRGGRGASRLRAASPRVDRGAGGRGTVPKLRGDPRALPARYPLRRLYDASTTKALFGRRRLFLERISEISEKVRKFISSITYISTVQRLLVNFMQIVWFFMKKKTTPQVSFIKN